MQLVTSCGKRRFFAKVQNTDIGINEKRKRKRLIGQQCHRAFQTGVEGTVIFKVIRNDRFGQSTSWPLVKNDALIQRFQAIEISAVTGNVCVQLEAEGNGSGRKGKRSGYTAAVWQQVKKNGRKFFSAVYLKCAACDVCAAGCPCRTQWKRYAEMFQQCTRWPDG